MQIGFEEFDLPRSGKFKTSTRINTKVLDVLKEEVESLRPNKFFKRKWYKAKLYEDITKNNIEKMEIKIQKDGYTKSKFIIFSEIIDEILSTNYSNRVELSQDIKIFFIKFIQKYQNDKNMMNKFLFSYLLKPGPTRLLTFKKLYNKIKTKLPDSFLGEYYTNLLSEEEIKAASKYFKFNYKY